MTEAESLLKPSFQLFVLSGPSGVGKDSVIAALRGVRQDIHVAVTVTTRAPRPNEVNGVHYWFVSPERFSEMRAAGEMLECAEVHGNWYGTPVAEVRESLKSRHCFLKIDVQGAAQIKAKLPHAVFIFLAPPSAEKLVSRLAGRGTETSREMARRLADAHKEMREMRRYDYVVVNDDNRVDQAVADVCCIVTAESLRVRPRHIEV